MHPSRVHINHIYSSLEGPTTVLSKLGPGKLGPGQLGPGAQLSALKKWQIEPQGPTVWGPICLEPDHYTLTQLTRPGP